MTIENCIAENLVKIAQYGKLATTEIWMSLSRPSSAPVILGNTFKASIGPAIAVLMSQVAFKWQESIKQKREADAARTMLKVEIDYNLQRIKALIEELKLVVEVLPPQAVHVPFRSSPHGFQTQAYDSQVNVLARLLEPEKLNAVCQRYADFRTLAYAYEQFQPKYIENWDEYNIAKCKQTLSDLRQANHLLSNPFN